MKLDGLTDMESAVFKWQFRLCGDFRKALWETICRADENNIELLARGFSTEVQGYKLYTCESGWWEKVKEKARKLGYLKAEQD